MNRKTLKESSLVATLAFLPILCYWWIKEFIYPRPFWAFYDHIETLYYYTAIELVEGLIPHNMDNPGSLVQVVGSVLVRIVGSLPEDYSQFQLLAHCLVLLLSFLSSIYLIRLTLGNVSRPLSIASVWMYFLFLVSLIFLQVWGPESFYYFIGALSIGCLFWLFEDPENISNWKTWCFGASIGLLLSVKFIFLAWLPGLCIVLFVSGLSIGIKTAIIRATLGLIGVVSSFLAVTFPMRDGYAYMFNWVLQNATRSGDYGRGDVALPSVTTALENWYDFLVSNKSWGLLFGVFLCFIIVSAFKARNTDKQDFKRISYIGCFALISIGFSLLFVLRSYAQRYMLPIGLCGVIIYILFAQKMNSAKPIYHYIVAGLVGLVLLKSMNNDFKTHFIKIEETSLFNQKVTKRINSLAVNQQIEKPVVIYGWRVPAPSFALRQHARYEHHQAAVDQLYPFEGHHTPWPDGHTFRIPNSQSHWDFAIIRKEYVDELPISDFTVVEDFQNYKILQPQ